MADNNLKQLQELFDRNLKPINERLDGIDQRLDTQLGKINRELGGINERLDLVAGHLATVDERLFKVEEIQKDHSRQLSDQDAALDRIERQLVKKDDRLDEHAERIEKLERKTAHLPDH
jgi:DNA repair ATPase RecN